MSSTCSRFLSMSAVISATFLAGCQFFFPMPVEPELEIEAPAQAVRTIGAPFEEGEVFEGRVFIEDVSAGEVSLRVGKRCLADGKLALPVSGKGRVGGLLSLLGSGDALTLGLIDLETSLPLEGRWDMTVDDKRTFVELDYASGRYRLHQLKEEAGRKPGNSYKRVDLATEQTPHDGHSLLGYLRRWDAPDGAHGFLYVVVGRNLFRIDVTPTGKESIRTSFGEREAMRIDGSAQRVVEKTLEPSTRHAPKPFTMWLSADDDRVPLRIVVTTELAELTIDLSKHAVEAVAPGEPQPCVERVDKRALWRARGPRKKREKQNLPPVPSRPHPTTNEGPLRDRQRPAPPAAAQPSAPPPK